MAKGAAPSPAVDEFISKLEHPLKPVVQSLRKIILMANGELSEGIKWNAPSYALDGEDRITFNLRAKGTIRLIFHCGAKVKRGNGSGRLLDDDSGLLEWAADDRAIANFHSLDDVKRYKADLAAVIKHWLKAAGTRS